MPLRYYQRVLIILTACVRISLVLVKDIAMLAAEILECRLGEEHMSEHDESCYRPTLTRSIRYVLVKI